MSLYREYHQPDSVSAALEILADGSRPSAVIAGGTDLLLDLRQGRHPAVERLIDVSEIPELMRIERDEDLITLGASVTHKQIISSDLLAEHARCVVEGCGLIGGPQVRNVATIGGNVAHGLPAGDGTIGLLALDTEVQISSPSGSDWRPLVELFAGPGKLVIDRSRELVTGFRFAARGEREGSAFHRVMRPQGVAIAILNMAAWVRLNAEGAFDMVRISCGPAGPRPFRARETEAYLAGRTLDDQVLGEAAQVLEQEVSLRTSAHRATKEYRHQILPVLLRNVLYQAVRRAKKFTG